MSSSRREEVRSFLRRADCHYGAALRDEEAGLSVEQAANMRDQVRPDRIEDLRRAINMVINGEHSLNRKQAAHEEAALRALLHFEEQMSGELRGYVHTRLEEVQREFDLPRTTAPLRCVTRGASARRTTENYGINTDTDLQGPISRFMKPQPRPADWSATENAATVKAYLSMLKRELMGVDFTKTIENAELRKHLNDRSKGAVEFKFQNISAVMTEKGWPRISGYKPQSNFQQSLGDEVVRQVEADSELQSLIAGNPKGLSPEPEPQSRQSIPTEDDVTWNSELFAQRLNLLFESELGPDGRPYTTEEVVRALQYEGIPISPSQLSELRRGHGERPTRRAVNSIAFFFNVTLDYLTADTGAAYRADTSPATEQPPSGDDSGTPQDVAMSTRKNLTGYLSLDDFGTCIAGLSRAIRDEMGDSKLDIEMVREISRLLEQAGQMLEAAGAGPVGISREFLEKVLTAWAIGGSGANARHETYMRITRTLREIPGA